MANRSWGDVHASTLEEANGARLAAAPAPVALWDAGGRPLAASASFAAAAFGAEAAGLLAAPGGRAWRAQRARLGAECSWLDLPA